MGSKKGLPQDWLNHLVSLEGSPVRPSHAIDSEPQPPEGFNHGKAFFFIFMAICGVVLAGWVLGSFYMSKIKIGNQLIPARSSDSSLVSAMNSQVSAYRLTILYPNKQTKHYPMKSLGFSLNSSASLSSTRQLARPLTKRVLWWQPVTADIKLNTDKTVLNGFIASSASQTVQPSQDAFLSIVGGQIQINNAVAGKQYGLIAPHHTLLVTASNLDPTALKLITLSARPALTSDVLLPYKATLDKVINQAISFSLGNVTLKPSVAAVANWLEITPNDKTKKVDINVNSGKVLAYINQAVAYDNQPPKTQIVIQQTDGSTQILVPGQNGITIGNSTEVATEVSKVLLKAGGINLPLQASYTSFKTITAASYPKWIEVDLTNKHLYAYETSNLVQTYPVTAGAPATPTVTGQYSIYSKYDVQDMRGGNVDGSQYFQPNVQWINYFYQDYAIHGNYWRPLSYFGRVNSSHGCVGLINSEAEWIYNWAPIGTPVIVHT